VNTSGYGLAGLIIRSPPSHPALRDALSSAFSYPILGLYTDNASAPLHARAGLRRVYRFGIHSHCACVNETAGLCTGTTFAYQFQPYTVITDDMLSNYSDYTNTLLRNTSFVDSSSLGRSSHAANYLLSLGTILSITSLVMSVRFRPPIFGLDSPPFVPPSGPIRFIRGDTWALLVSASAGVSATISVFAGSAIWTAVIKQANDVNSRTVQPNQLPLGIEVSAGTGLVCAWIAFGFLVPSAIPLTIRSASFPSDSYASRALIHPCFDVA